MKTVIEMAREAGLLTIGTAEGSEAVYTWPKGITEELERFAELVRADEREACWEACDRLTMYGPVAEAQKRYNQAYGHCKDAIRARKENT